MRVPLFARIGALAACLALVASWPARVLATPSGAAPVATDSRGLDLSDLDPACPACKDFAGFVNGGFAKHHPIPADRSDYDADALLSDQRLVLVRGILDDAAAHARPGTDAAKLGTFYRACLDTTGRDAAGLAPLAGELAKIEAVGDRPALVAEVASLQQAGVDAVYAFASEPDPKHSQATIAGLAHGSLGLPEREYYLRTDRTSRKERADYARFIGTYLALAGPADASAATPVAAASPAQLLAFETALAKLEPTRAQERDPVANYHYVTFASLQKYAPEIDWSAYLGAQGAPAVAHLDVARPDYVIAATRLLAATPLPVMKTYLRYRLLLKYAPELPASLDRASFAFFQTELRGVVALRPQWQRCVYAADRQLQDLVSVVFARKAFSPEAKARAVALTENVHAALHDDLATLGWMSPPTRRFAERKLGAMVKKIGYPDHPLDYGDLTLVPGPYAQQVLATERFATALDMRRIGKPTDRTLWGMSADEVNAYYDDSNNEIVFPAGILAIPYFDPNADDAVNYGGIGAVIGHETTHGFDDSGRQFDADGNLTDWWQPADAARFKSRAKCIVNQYSSYTSAGTHLNGEAVQGEAIADLGGLVIAYRAFEKTPEARAAKKIGGYTPEQRFFMSYAIGWADNQRPAAARTQALTDPHPPEYWRIVGVLADMPEFRAAFHCKAIGAMVREPPCEIW